MNAAALPRTRRAVPLAMAAACALAVAAALFAQHVLGMRPCPWCILQRLLFILIALVALGTAFAPTRRLRIALNVTTLLLACAGVIAAVYQHEVAAKSFSCNLTFADKLVSALGIESLWPWMFQVTASCAESATKLLGVPFEFWSLALFALLAIVSAGLVLRAIRVEAG